MNETQTLEKTRSRKMNGSSKENQLEHKPAAEVQTSTFTGALMRIRSKVTKGMLDLLSPWRDSVNVGIQTLNRTFQTASGNRALEFKTEDGQRWSILEAQIFGLHFSSPDTGLLIREDGKPAREGDESYYINPQVPFGRDSRKRVPVFG